MAALHFGAASCEASIAALSRVQALSRDLLTQCGQSELAAKAGVKKRAKSANKTRDQAQAKVRGRMEDNFNFVRLAEGRLREGEYGTKQVTLWQKRLQHERYAVQAALKVCDRRQEIREDRPDQESAPDRLQQTLSVEWAVLENARKELLVLEEQARVGLEELELVHTNLDRGTARRRFAINTDRASIIHENITPLVYTNGAADVTCESMVAANDEDALAAEADEHCQRLRFLTESAGSFCTRCREAIERIRQTCSRANTQTCSNMAHFTTAKEDLTKQIRKEAEQASQVILVAGRSLDITRRKLVAGDQPGLARFNATKDMLERLTNSRQDLKEDLSTKMAALHIDSRCRKVTSSWASIPERPKTAGSVRHRASKHGHAGSRSCSVPILDQSRSPGQLNVRSGAVATSAIGREGSAAVPAAPPPPPSWAR